MLPYVLLTHWGFSRGVRRVCPGKPFMSSAVAQLGELRAGKQPQLRTAS